MMITLVNANTTSNDPGISGELENQDKRKEENRAEEMRLALEAAQRDQRPLLQGLFSSLQELLLLSSPGLRRSSPSLPRQRISHLCKL